MTEPKWTKGPWRIARVNMGNLIEARTGAPPCDELDDGYAAVATVQACTSDRSVSARRANASANLHLVAAAPEMFEALTELLRIDENLSGQKRDDAMEELLEKAKAVLAKASGETP